MQGLKNPDLFKQECYIAGEWVGANNGAKLEVHNPSNNTFIGHIPNCGDAETKRAITAAQDAFLSWRQLSAKERSMILLQWANLITQSKEDLARIMTLEEGKPYAESLTEIDYANSFIYWFATEARRIYGDIIPANKANERLLVLKQPIGVVAAITPWNFPAAMITRKTAPALAAGCTVVIKPAEDTPYSAFALAALAEKAGIPAGVINVVTGNPAVIGKELTTNPLVKKVSFTGSTEVGRILMAQSASTIKKVSLELGGNAPFIVYDDADLDEALAGLMVAKFRNTGQTCVGANRIYVQDKVYDEFSKKVVAAVKKLKVGDGFTPDVSIGPLINEDAIKKVTEHVRDAESKGGKILCGGKPHALGKLFFEPTVIANANKDMLLAREETFGPVAPLFRFESEEESIHFANDTPFGLIAYFYSKQIDRIWRVAESLEAGMIGINTGLVSNEVGPFGGVKQSGIGREGSKYGIEEYVEIKYMCLQIA